MSNLKRLVHLKPPKNRRRVTWTGPDGPERSGHRVPGPERLGQVNDDPDHARSAAGRRGAGHCAGRRQRPRRRGGWAHRAAALMNARPARLFDGVLAGYQGAGRRGRRGLALVSAASGLDPAGAGNHGVADRRGLDRRSRARRRRRRRGSGGVHIAGGRMRSARRSWVSSMSSGWSVISATGG